MILLAQFLLCSSVIFTPLRFHTPRYGIAYQTNGVPCGGQTDAQSLGLFAQDIDDSYHEFVCGPVDYECSWEEDADGNRPLAGQGMMAACYRPLEDLTLEDPLGALERNLRKLICRLNLSFLSQTEVFVQRFDWRLPGKCAKSLKWGVVAHDDVFTSQATIVLSAALPREQVKEILAIAWYKALFQQWVGSAEGCIE